MNHMHIDNKYLQNAAKIQLNNQKPLLKILFQRYLKMDSATCLKKAYFNHL